MILLSNFFCFLSSLHFSLVLRVNKFIFFQPSFIVFHSYYKWNYNIFLPLYDKCISFEMGWIFFQSNLIQFAVWYWGISLFYLMNFERDYHFFLIHSNETSHDKRFFSSRLSSYFQPITISNNDFIVDFLLFSPPSNEYIIIFNLLLFNSFSSFAPSTLKYN